MFAPFLVNQCFHNELHTSLVRILVKRKSLHASEGGAPFYKGRIRHPTSIPARPDGRSGGLPSSHHPASRTRHPSSGRRGEERGGGRGERVNFCRENKVVFRKAVYGVGESSDFHIAPAECNVGVMSLALGERADFVDERERLGEVFGLELPVEFMLVSDFP